MAGIGEAGRQSGVNIETIRYYEREGITPAPARTAAGRRDYGPADIANLRFVRRCRELGFSMTDIRALLALRSDNQQQCETVSEISRQHAATVRDKIAALEAMARSLDELTAECAEGRTDCPALKELFSSASTELLDRPHPGRPKAL